MATIDAAVILILALTSCAGIMLLRRQHLWLRLAFEAIALGGLTAMLRSHGTSPVLEAATGVGMPNLWLRLLAAIWWLVAARILASLLGAVLGHDERSREARLVSDLLGAGVYLLAGLCIVDFVLALPVKGLLATSGVVAVVIGLALQNTLADVFSGIAVGIEAPFSVGDRISLGDNIEGIVVQINWRSTRVRTDGEDVAIIPNSRVARLDIVNRSVPTRQRAARIEVQCPASSAPEEVIDLLMQATLLSPGLLAVPAPSASLIHLGLRRNIYAVNFSVARTSELSAAKGQLLLAIRRQLHRAGHLQAMPGANPDHQPDHQLDHREGILRETGLFRDLAPTQIAMLAVQLEPVTLAKGERLFSQGEVDPALYMVAAGVIEIAMIDANDRMVSLGRLGLGDFVGEVCLLTGIPHPASATALTRCEVHRLSRPSIEPLLRSNPELIPRIERAVRLALDQIDRGVSAQVGLRAAGSGALLDRIYSFFRHGPA
jgi:small-conductance mechanosensitive channel